MNTQENSMGDRIDLEGTRTTKCRNCGQEIVFLTSKRTGKKYPTDVFIELGCIVTYRGALHSRSCSNSQDGV